MLLFNYTINKGDFMGLTKDFLKMVNDENINICEELKEAIKNNILSIKTMYLSIHKYKNIPKYVKLFYKIDSNKSKIGTMFKIDSKLVDLDNSQDNIIYSKEALLFLELFRLNKSIKKQRVIEEHLKKEFDYNIVNNSINGNIEQYTNDRFIALRDISTSLSKVNRFDIKLNGFLKKLDNTNICILNNGKVEINMRYFEDLIELLKVEFADRKEINIAIGVLKSNYQRLKLLDSLN